MEKINPSFINAYSNSSFNSLEILKLPELLRENMTVYFYNTLNRSMNFNVSPYMVFHTEIQEHYTRKINQPVIPSTRKSHTQAGILF